MPPKNLSVKIATTLPLLIAAGLCHAQDLPQEPVHGIRPFLGGDIRIRQEAFDNIPIPTEAPSVTRGGNNNYFRVRTRLSGGAAFGENASLNIRAINEFRHRNTGKKAYEFPDELIVDSLNIRLEKLFGTASEIVVGRQDMKLGSGRMFFEGTGMDGSRTTYFDGVRGAFALSDSLTLDAVAVYTAAENALAIGHEHRNLTGYAASKRYMDEAAAGAFLTHTIPDTLRTTLYYLWKHDTAWETAAGDAMPGEDIHTVGVWLRPQFTPTLSADFEYAYQASPSSDADRRAFFAFSGLTFAPAHATKPHVSVNVLYLSGDDPDTAKREDWNPLFGRYPWISELVVFAYDTEGAGCWNNLLYGYIDAGFSPAEGHRLAASAGIMAADEKDGAGGGRTRGCLVTGRYDFPIPIVDNLCGYLLAEAFFPDDYYTSDKTAYFLRWQIAYSF